MQKISFLFLLLVIGIALIGIYEAFSGSVASVSFVRFFALSGFFLLCLSLIIGPLVVFWPKEYATLIEPRRAVGLLAFFFTAFHVILVMSLYLNWQIALVISQLSLLIAVPAVLILLVLALTSNDFAVRKLGMIWWKRIQIFNYLAFILVFVHFIMNANGLFVRTETGLFINFAEVGLVLLGIVTVGLQIAGFLMRKSMTKLRVESE